MNHNDAETLLNELSIYLNRFALNLTNKEEENISSIELDGEIETKVSVTGVIEEVGAYYFGYSKDKSIRRLILGVSINLQTNRADILLIATRGDTNAHPNLFGNKGEGIGNPVLVARLLHLSISFFSETKVTEIINSPWNQRLRLLYCSMGFKNGEIFALKDPQCIEMAREFISNRYESLKFERKDPPLP